MIDNLWTSLFQVANWFFLGLLYLALFVVVLATRRELQRHVGAAKSRVQPAVAPGRLRVVAAGSDLDLTVGQIITLDHQATIGAAPDNTLILQDNFVSSYHARLYWDGAGWWVEDLDSRNGVLLDGQPCAPHRPQPVPFGAELGIGDIVLKLLES
jgi:hypothetical protein